MKKKESGAPKMAFGGLAPNQTQQKIARPPLIPKTVQTVDGFDKKEWIREYRLMKKDIVMEERDRYRPLLCIKRDLNEFILECEKAEKKDTIELKKEIDQQMQFVER